MPVLGQLRRSPNHDSAVYIDKVGRIERCPDRRICRAGDEPLKEVTSVAASRRNDP